MKKLYKLVVVQQAVANDPDVAEFKAKEQARELQAKRRAERAQAHKEQKDKLGFNVNINPKHKKFNSTLACKLYKAIN